MRYALPKSERERGGGWRGSDRKFITTAGETNDPNPNVFTEKKQTLTFNQS